MLLAILSLPLAFAHAGDLEARQSSPLEELADLIDVAARDNHPERRRINFGRIVDEVNRISIIAPQLLEEGGEIAALVRTLVGDVADNPIVSGILNFFGRGSTPSCQPVCARLDSGNDIRNARLPTGRTGRRGRPILENRRDATGPRLCHSTRTNPIPNGDLWIPIPGTRTFTGCCFLALGPCETCCPPNQAVAFIQMLEAMLREQEEQAEMDAGVPDTTAMPEGGAAEGGAAPVASEQPVDMDELMEMMEEMMDAEGRA